MAEFAKLIGLDAPILEATVKEYSDNITKGEEPQFGRKTLTYGYGKPSQIATAPFYAFPSTAIILRTYGGILTNGKTQIIDAYGEIISGFYAAGEIVGGVHGAAFGKAIIFGRIAAKNALS